MYVMCCMAQPPTSRGKAPLLPSLTPAWPPARTCDSAIPRRKSHSPCICIFPQTPGVPGSGSPGLSGPPASPVGLLLLWLLGSGAGTGDTPWEQAGDCRRTAGTPFHTRSLCTMDKPGPGSKWAGRSQYDFRSMNTRFIKLSILYNHPHTPAAIRTELTSCHPVALRSKPTSRPLPASLPR